MPTMLFSSTIYKGRLLEVNRAAEHLTGYSRSEVLGKNFDELIAPEARTIVRDIARAHLGGQRSAALRTAGPLEKRPFTVP